MAPSTNLASQFSSLLAHDLNNHLALVLANLEFLDEFYRDRSDNDPDVVDAVSGSQIALHHMMSLVRNLGEIGKMEDPALRPVFMPTDITALLKHSLTVHHPSHKAMTAEMRLECPDALKADVDSVMLKRIVHNLLGNATRYVVDSGVIRVSAAVEPDPSGPLLAVTVANSGPAIPDAARPTLFEKYRVNSEGRVQRSMGLYYCRLACEAHGGSIQLTSDDEFPVRFTVRVPLRRASTQSFEILDEDAPVPAPVAS